MGRGSTIQRQTAPQQHPAAPAGGSTVGRVPAMPAESRLVYIIIGSVLFLVFTLAGVFMSMTLARGASDISGMFGGAEEDPGGSGTRPGARPLSTGGGGRRAPRDTRPVAPDDVHIRLMYDSAAAQEQSEVYVDGRRAPVRIAGGRTVVFTTRPGSRYIESRHPAYDDYQYTNTFRSGERRTIHVRYSGGSAATSGQATLKFYWPAGAQRSGSVRLDSQLVKPDIRGDYAYLQTTPGLHSLELRRRSFRTNTTGVTAQAGETKLVTPLWNTGLTITGGPAVNLATIGIAASSPPSPTNWTRTGPVMHSPTTAPATPATMGLSRRPPEEYVIEIRAMRVSGTGPFQIGLSHGATRFSLQFGGTGGISICNYRGSEAPLSPAGPDPFRVGRLQSLRIYVSPHQVSVDMPGASPRFWTKGLTGLSRAPAWDRSTSLEIGVQNCVFRISSLRMYATVE